MKNYLLPFLLAIIFVSCSNDDDGIENQLVGSWNWLESSGGIAGTTETPQTTDEIRKLEISTDSIKNYQNGNLIFKTKYTIEIKESVLFNESRKMIIQENGFRQIIDISGNKLILIGDCNDCFQSEYEKQ